MFYTWRKADIDVIVQNLSKSHDNLNKALDLNWGTILAAASRYFQSKRSKIALAINNGCRKIVKYMIVDEEDQKKEIKKVLENNSTVRSPKLGRLVT